jgi:hypothetical protein
VRIYGERDDGDVGARNERGGVQARRRAPRVVQLQQQLVDVAAAAAECVACARHAAGRGGQHHARADRADRAEERGGGGAGQRPPPAGRRGRGRRRARRQGGARYFGQHRRQLCVKFLVRRQQTFVATFGPRLTRVFDASCECLMAEILLRVEIKWFHREF